MKLQLGDIIKELRKRDGRTQEDLATALCISTQAVSRWETNNGYPDIEILPAIANYFHITIDELFGYDSDRESHIQEIISQADSYLKRGESINECLKILRAGAKEFPSEPRIWLKLGFALSAQAQKFQEVRIRKKELSNYVEFDTEHNLQNTIAQEAVSVFEKVLDMSLNSDQRASVVFNLVNHYATMGMYDRAKKLAFRQNPIGSSREFLLAYACADKERDINNSTLIIGLLRMLKWAAIWAIGTKYSVRSSEYAIHILLSIANVYKNIIDDHNYGIEHCDLSDIYAVCAVIYARMERLEDLYKYVDLAIYHREAYDKVRAQKAFEYSSELFSSVHYSGEELPEFTMSSLQDMFQKLPDTIKQKLKQEQKYRKYICE
ncbi:MAG: helix-turn-helix transcriptional regulator [Clostridia bacterium]|nr:helix-turn-helix transcriptional regulator [Clostridia bacterium]